MKGEDAALKGGATKTEDKDGGVKAPLQRQGHIHQREAGVRGRTARMLGMGQGAGLESFSLKLVS